MRVSWRGSAAALLLAQLLTGAGAGERCAHRTAAQVEAAVRGEGAVAAVASAGAVAARETANGVAPGRGTDRPNRPAPASEPPGTRCGGTSAPALPSTGHFALAAAVIRTALGADERVAHGPAYPPPLQPPRFSLPA